MMRPQSILALLALTATLVLPSAATGQNSRDVSALKGHATDAPIDVSADRIEVRDNDKQAIFSGAVTIIQSGMKLDAAKVTVFYGRGTSASPEISRIDANGDVRLVTASETAASRYAIYDVTQKTLTMIGDVLLTRGGSVLNGNRLEIKLGTGESTLDGAGTKANPSGRVTGRFIVPPRAPK